MEKLTMLCVGNKTRVIPSLRMVDYGNGFEYESDEAVISAMMKWANDRDKHCKELVDTANKYADQVRNLEKRNAELNKENLRLHKELISLNKD